MFGLDRCGDEDDVGLGPERVALVAACGGFLGGGYGGAEEEDGEEGPHRSSLMDEFWEYFL